jgi:hypothetical protein
MQHYHFHANRALAADPGNASLGIHRQWHRIDNRNSLGFWRRYRFSPFVL